MLQTITYGVFAERVRRRLANGYPDQQFNVTNNEIYLYLYEATAAVITAQSRQAYAVDGIYGLPDGFVTTYKFNLSSITKNNDTGDYEVTLPQPPVNLPLGYSVLSPMFVGAGMRSMPLIAINSYQKGYALKIATPKYGAYYSIEGSKMQITVPSGYDLTNSGLKLHVPMLSARSATGEETEMLSVPDDAMGLIFDQVIARLTGRMMTPADQVNDGVAKV